MTMPAQKPGRSKQDYGTPLAFIKAVEARFGPIVCDLAASAGNAKAVEYYDEDADSLEQPWSITFPTGLLWLNPPFADISPWAEKCALESSKRHGLIAMLTPASIGAVWFAEHVRGKAMVLGLSPRLTFDGASDPYPKDLSLLVFSCGLHGFDTWRWVG
jgi:phage N-6-adenine-methyltransferase